MTVTIDHYATLGILPDADDAIIAAVYRALVKKFHPDVASGDKNKALNRFRKIQEAYDVLRDPEKRRAYDAEQKLTRTSDYADYAAATENEPADEDQVANSDWSIAARYVPEICTLRARLAALSPALAVAFQAALLSSRRFDTAEQLAAKMQRDFLERYFGTSTEIHEFAKFLIIQKNRAAVLELNNAVRVLGSSVEPYHVIGEIMQWYGLNESDDFPPRREPKVPASILLWIVGIVGAGIAFILLFGGR